MKNPLMSERGSLSLIIVMVIMAVSTILIMNYYTSLNFSISLHKRQKQRVNLQPQMYQLAKLFQQSYVASQIDPTCSSLGKKGFYSARKINGIRFCLPKDGNLCVKNTINNVVSKHCIPTDSKSLNWKSPDGIKGIGKQKSSKTKSKGLVTKNSLTIPSTSKKSIWRSCSSSPCVRLLLCPENQTTCTAKTAVASQIIRLGQL